MHRNNKITGHSQTPVYTIPLRLSIWINNYSYVNKNRSTRKKTGDITTWWPDGRSIHAGLASKGKTGSQHASQVAFKEARHCFINSLLLWSRGQMLHHINWFIWLWRVCQRRPVKKTENNIISARKANNNNTIKRSK